MPHTRMDPPKSVTIRARMMWAMVVLASAALLTSGTIVGLIQQANISRGVDANLLRSSEELRVLAQRGVDPETGEPFSGASELLRTFLERTVIGPAEGEVAFVGQEVVWVASDDVELRPEKDQQLLEQVKPLLEADQISLVSITTDQRHYRVMVSPVQFPQGRGALVHVHDLDVAKAELRRTMTLYAAVAALTVAAVVLVAWWAVGRLLRPIEDLRKAADSIDERDLTTRVPVRGKDDLTALAATLNRMLDRVERSVDAQRQLLDDVGHELRTPITVVRGHLELVDASDPQDVAQTRHLVIDELDRMSVLVNDLLVLAKADQSDFVSPTWVDVTELTDQVLEKASALGERKWVVEHLADAEARLDPGRITQAWLQLAANAVKYSEVGSRVGLGSALRRGELLLWVRDEGIGIPEEAIATIKERFVRAAGAAEHAPGAGLGLSIVDSIVKAHDGRLLIESTPDGGSTFTMALPWLPEPSSPATPTLED